MRKYFKPDFDSIWTSDKQAKMVLLKKSFREDIRIFLTS